MNIECLEKGGKIHSLKSELDDGTHIMACGLAQQKPFKTSIASTLPLVSLSSSLGKESHVHPERR